MNCRCFSRMTCGFCGNFHSPAAWAVLRNESRLQLAERICRGESECGGSAHAAFALRHCDRFDRRNRRRTGPRRGNHVESPRLPRALRNCARGGGDLPATAPIRSAEAERNRRKSCGRGARRDRSSGHVRPVHGARDARRKSAAFARLAAPAPGSDRPEFD